MSTIAITPRPFGVPARVASSSVAATAARPARLRLTARGRAVLLLLIAIPLVLWIAFAQLNAGSAVGTLEDGASVPIVMVQPGESLWSIAERVAPSADPRDVIDAIVAFNHLGSADVMAGQQIGIPAPYSR